MAKFCTNCGAEISEGYAFCEKCGTPVEGGTPQGQPIPQAQQVVVNNVTPQKQTNVCALIGFITSLLCGCLSPVSIVLCIIGIVKAKDYNGDGKGLAIAGLVISILALLISLAYYFIIVVAAVAESGY